MKELSTDGQEQKPEEPEVKYDKILTADEVLDRLRILREAKTLGEEVGEYIKRNQDDN